MTRWTKTVDKSTLHPGLVAVVEATLDKLEAAGTPFKVYSGLRTFAEQEKLYAQGRTVEGSIVTKARGGQSMHNYGLAVDLAPMNLLTADTEDLWWPEPEDRGGDVWFALEQALYEASGDIDAGDAWDAIDYEWGGRWRFRDVPHIQVRTTVAELQAGHYPFCRDVEWLVKAHTTFLYEAPWINKRVQHLLNMQSYAAGEVDGQLGSNSQAALLNFQRDQDLPATADVDRKTVERLVRVHQEAQSVR